MVPQPDPRVVLERVTVVDLEKAVKVVMVEGEDKKKGCDKGGKVGPVKRRHSEGGGGGTEEAKKLKEDKVNYMQIKTFLVLRTNKR